MFQILHQSVHEQQFIKPMEVEVEVQNGPLPNGQTFVLKVLDPTNNECSGEQASCLSTYAAAFAGLLLVLTIASGILLDWASFVLCVLFLVLLIIILLALYTRYQSIHGGIWTNHILCINIDDDKIYIIKQFVNTSEWTLKHTVKLSEITFSLDQNTSIMVPLPICCCSFAFEKIIIVINLDNGQKIKFNDSNASLSRDQAKIYLDSVCNYLHSSQNQEPQNQQSEQQQQIVEQEGVEQDRPTPNTEHVIDVNDLEQSSD